MINADIDLKMGATLACNLVINNWYNTEWYIDTRFQSSKLPYFPIT